MPFLEPFDEFKFHFVRRDPDFVKSDTNLSWQRPDTNLVFVTPAGTEADGQSVHWLVWPLVGHKLEGESIRAAFQHDYDYQTGRKTRRQADADFLTAMLEEGVHPAEAYGKWAIVRAGAFVSWRRHRAKDKFRGDKDGER
jgi:hypothetical protein